MNDEQVDRHFHEIAQHVATEDEGLMRRVTRIERRETVHVALVFALLTAAAVLLTLGLAVVSPLFWCAGVTAFLAAPVADHLLQPI